ncbi:putative ABC transporter ATP-binding protein [Clostridiales bacterium CHKCI006]|nr:putative ABC transporter ATP-binding protein [Clostridiales bacterium CHKCI006]
MLLQASELTVKYGERIILDHEKLFIEPKQKIGVVGLNGNGKSTLLKIIASLDHASGQFAVKPGLTIAYLEQTWHFQPGQRVREAMLERCPSADLYQMQSILTRLKVPDLEAIACELSGGQQRRVALAGALINKVDLLILDEPTNHLDIEMVEWLEKYLIHYPGAILMSTHDRYFLEHVTKTIVEVSDGHLYMSQGGYQGYLDYRMTRLEQAQAAKRKRESFLRREKLWVEAGVEARRTKSRDRLERYEKLKAMDDLKPSGSMEIQTGMQRLGKKAIVLEQVSRKIGSRVLFEPFSYRISPFERIGIIGENGCGKSTLLNILCQRDPSYEGTIDWGETVVIGYFDQLSRGLDPKMRAYDFIAQKKGEIHTRQGIITAKKMMEDFLFDEHTLYLPIERLSGGQQRRLYLLSVLMDEPNILVLDEPTNDLDIDTLTVLENYLDDFEGIVITVSHDRYFLDKVVDRIWAFEDAHIQVYNGGYSDYASVQKENADKQKVAKNKLSRPRQTRKLSYLEMRELERLEGEIGELEEKKRQVDAAFDGVTDFVKISALTQEQNTLEALLEEKELRYLELMEKLETLNHSA